MPGCISIIPARGGSKSIPLKNIAPLSGRPLIDYSIIPAKASRKVDRVVCNTDHVEIADRCKKFNIEAYQRPPHLGGDDVSVTDVLGEMLRTMYGAEVGVAEDIALLMQPTSPFVRVEHIDGLIDLLRSDKSLGSAQTIVECPHNHHAINQRVIDNEGHLGFKFPDERKKAYNKQKKPSHYLFGNLVAFRIEAFLEQENVFAVPGGALKIEYPYDFDADNAWDFQVANALMNAGLVELPHMDSE